jgi:hypothetical protein
MDDFNREKDEMNIRLQNIFNASNRKERISKRE